nr:MAG TPA: hypothetical protein [Caudoviricetes sp.]
MLPRRPSCRSANYFYEGKNENFEGSSKAALLPC